MTSKTVDAFMLFLPLVTFESLHNGEHWETATLYSPK